MTRKGENIFKRSDGRYEARYVKGYNGKRAIYGYVYSKNYIDVKRKRNEKLISLNIEKEKYKKDIAISSFKEAINSWLKKEQSFIKESTFCRYSFMIEKYLLTHLSKYKLCDIDEDVINDFIRKLKINNLSNNTIHDIISLLKQILKSYNLSINIKKIKKEQKSVIIFNSAEREIIKKNALVFDNIDAFGIVLCLYTGLRIGEICALKVSDIDLENKTIYINKTLIRIKDNDSNINKTKIIISKPKSNKSIRHIPIPDKIMPYIKNYVDQSKMEYFFITNSSNFIEPRSYYNHYLNYLKKWNIEKKKFHCLRHTFATRSVEIGFDPKILSELLGHSNVNITLNLYVHPTIETKRKYLNNLFNKF